MDDLELPSIAAYDSHAGTLHHFRMLCFAAFPVVGIPLAADNQRCNVYASQRNSWARSRQCAWVRRSVNVVQNKVGHHHLITSSLKSSKDWGQIRAKDFDDLINNGQLPLCLVGMSNCGKSHWSEQLSNFKGFNRVCVDDEIENAIRPELESLGYAGISGMAEWMGYPFDDRFASNEKRYLKLEEEITAGIIPSENSNFVLDTTGSVVYLGSQTLSQLRSSFLIVHLAATEDVLENMKKSYFETPKPVVWGDSYNSLDSETPLDSLRRCYDGLLQQRYKRYSQLAHIAVPASISLSRDIDVDQFLEIIRSKLVSPAGVPRS